LFLSAARTGYKRVSFAGWLEGFAARTGYKRVSFAGWLVGFAARTGYEQVSFAGWLVGSLRERAMSGFRSPAGCGSFSFAAAGDRQGGASRRAPLTPGSGRLHRRFAVPSPL